MRFFNTIYTYLSQCLELMKIECSIFFWSRRWPLLFSMRARRELREGREGIFSLTISLIVKILLIDGGRGNIAFDTIERLFRDALGLDTKHTLLAMEIYQRELHSQKPFKEVIDQYFYFSKQHPVLLENLIDILYMAARADGVVCIEESRILDIAINTFNLSKQEVLRIKNRRVALEEIFLQKKRLEQEIFSRDSYGFRKEHFRDSRSQSQRSRSFYSQQGYRAPSGKQRECAYTILGASPKDSKVTIKKRYRKLVKKYHPDRLISQGLPEEMIHVYTERFRKIQKAYEEIV